MTQAADFSVKRIGTETPTAMFGRIDDSFDSLLSSHAGTSRPTYAVEGTIWLSTATPGADKYYFFDGNTDHLFLSIDKTTGARTVNVELLLDPAFATSAAPTKKAAFDLALITAGQLRNIKVPDTDTALSKWEIIGDYSFTAVSQLVVTNLSAFRSLRISGALISSVAANIAMQFSDDNGGAYAGGGSDYSGQYLRAQGNSAPAIAAADNPSISLSGALLTVNGTYNHFEASLALFNKAIPTEVNVDCSTRTGGALFLTRSVQSRNSATAQNALRIFTSGTITGSITIEGIRG